MDWTYIDTLLSVIHQASAAGPKFTAIAAKAAAELEAYMADPTPPQEEPDDE